MKAREGDALRISEAARQLGVSAQYLRLLEGEGRIPTARRIFGCRIFSADDVARLKSMGVGSGKRLSPFAEGSADA
jgi:predicted site-specific integrase-resolvase